MACNCKKNAVRKAVARQVTTKAPVAPLDAKKAASIKGVVKRPAR